MAEKDVTLGIQLDSAGLKAGAESGAAALAELESQIKGDTQALAQMQKAMKDLQGGTVVNVEQFRKLQTAIDAKKQSIATARASYLSLGGSFERSRRGGKSLQSQLAELSKTVQGMPGPLAGIVAMFSKLIGLVANNPIKTALVAVAAAMVGVTGKVISLTAALTRYAIAQADVRRSELLRLEGLTKIRNYYGVAAGSAKDLQDAIDQTAASSALSRDQIAGLAEQLYRAHFRGDNLRAALEAAAIKQSTQGTEQTNMWIGYAEAINRTGGNVQRFAQNVKNQLGGIAQKQTLSATVQAQKLQESYAALTNDIDINPLLKARAQTNALFSQATASGRALKTLLSTLIQPIINQITRVQPIVKRFFQGMILAALEFGTAVLEVLDALGVEFGSELPSDMEDSRTAVNAGKAAFDLLVGSMWSLAAVTSVVILRQSILALQMLPKLLVALARTLVSIAAQIVKWAIWAAEIFLTIAPILLMVAAVWLLIEVINGLVQIWEEIDFTLLGRYMYEGLIAYWDKITGWVKSIGQSIVDTFKSVFQISSPSKVFMGIGENIGEGLQQGIDATAPDVNQSVEHLVDVPGKPAAGPAAGPAAATAAPGNTVVIQNVNLNGYADAGQAADDFVTELAKALRVVGYQLGTVGGAAT